MRTTLIAVVALLALVSSVHAEVLVYSGTVRRLATGDEPSAQKRKTYVVVDQFQKRIAVMSWGRDPLGKRHDFPDVRNVDYLTFPRSDGTGLEDGFATATAIGTFTGVGGGGYGSVFLHGLQVPVTIAVNGDTKIVQPRAKLLTGHVAGAATTILGAYYSEDEYTVKLDGKHTIQANGAGQTVDAAMAQLVGEIEAAGFVEK